MKRYRLPNDLTVFHLTPGETLGLYEEIFEERTYLKHGISLRNGDTLFDVGANIGLASLFFTKDVPGVRVYAFEPSPTTFAALKANMELHRVDAKLYNCAVAGAPGTADFTFYPNAPGMSGLYADETVDRDVQKAFMINRGFSPRDAAYVLEKTFEAEKLRCPVRTISEIVAEENVERIDLLKIDVEKAELDVLAGIIEADWPRVRQVVAEVHDVEGRLDHLLGMFEQRGYEVVLEQERTLKDTRLHNIFARQS